MHALLFSEKIIISFGPEKMFFLFTENIYVLNTSILGLYSGQIILLLSDEPKNKKLLDESCSVKLLLTTFIKYVFS